MNHDDCLVHAVPRRQLEGPTMCGLDVSIAGLREAGLQHAHTTTALRTVTCPVCIDVVVGT